MTTITTRRDLIIPLSPVSPNGRITGNPEVMFPACKALECIYEIGCSLANGKTLYAFDAFLVENGEIIEQLNHYDPRPATG